MKKKNGGRKPRRTGGKYKPAYQLKRKKKRVGDRAGIDPLLIEEVVGMLSQQILNLEIKASVQQFLLNDAFDLMQQKGWLSDKEVKGLYQRTFQYWKNGLMSKGNPFAELDVTTLPALQLLKKQKKGIEELSDRDRTAELAKPTIMKPAIEGEANLIHEMKEEMKAMKREFLRQRLEEIKLSQNKDML